MNEVAEQRLLDATYRFYYFVLWLVTLNNLSKPYLETYTKALKQNSKSHPKKKCGLKFLNLNQPWKYVSSSLVYTVQNFI